MVSLARKSNMDVDDTTVSEEAKRRVDTARLSELAFRIKRAFPDFDEADANTLARVLFEATDKRVPVTPSYIRDRMVALGRSDAAAKRVAERFS
jgi:hypothetical protein